MPISANAVWEIRADATANNVNGGFFVTGSSGTDFSQQPTAQYALTGVTSSGAGNTILTASAAANMVGNGIRVVSGTNFTVGWFQITSVVAGVSITCSTNAAGTAISTGVGASGVMNVGGASSLNSTLDDDMFEEMIGGNIVWVRGTSGVITLGESIAVASTSSTGDAPVVMIGYNTTRGDYPSITSGLQPTIACGANSLTVGQFWQVFNLKLTGTATSVLAGASNTKFFSCNVINTSTTVDRFALSLPTANAFIFYSEAVSIAGQAINGGSTVQFIVGCYTHDSRDGIQLQSNSCFVSNCVSARFLRSGLRLGASSTGRNTVMNNTIINWGNITQIGTGIEIPSGNSPMHNILGNIVVNCATGLLKTSTAQLSIVNNWNDLFNNTANYSVLTAGTNDTTLDPQFVNAGFINGTTATTSGSVLTQTGAAFDTNGVNTSHYIYVISGTGVTTGIYPITGVTSTTITSSNTFGTSSAGDVNWIIGNKNNFNTGSLMTISPMLFYGSETKNSLNLGAVQPLQGSVKKGGVGGGLVG